MQKLKELARRGTALLAAVSLLGGVSSALLPAIASADSLNPLTERSLLLSSASPGWSFVDGSGNALYAPPNSGPNGKKSGQTFTFRVSSTATIKAFTFQYCTTPAGKCLAPGNDSGGGLSPVVARGSDDASHSDLNVVTSSPAEVGSSNWTTIQGRANKLPLRNSTEGNFAMLYGSASPTTYSSGWTMAASNQEENTTTHTGKNNFITLSNTTGQAFTAGDYVKVVFFATDTNYITNPGDDAFFAKINDYNSTTIAPGNLVDGGVTVANIMNESIQIQTKVLETMDFSVGIIDPNTVDETTLGFAHGPCDPILTKMPGSSSIPNSLFMGDTQSEDSLATNRAYDTHSYWRLSSNSSGGATVYYSGATLKNTVGDEIAPIGDTATPSRVGTEQFGLAIDHGTDTTPGHEIYPYDPAKDSGDSSVDNGGTADSAFTTYLTTINDPIKAHGPQLYPLIPTAQYGGGSGTIVNGGTATFAFNANANTVPVPIATELTDVVNCVSAKMRYIGNIAAITPAGIYATKINYLAAPQY
jgi:hypothetical protein